MSITKHIEICFFICLFICFCFYITRKQAQELKDTIAEEKERNTLTSLNFVVRASHASAVQGGYGYHVDGTRSQRNTSAEMDIASLGGKDSGVDLANAVANP